MEGSGTPGTRESILFFKKKLNLSILKLAVVLNSSDRLFVSIVTGFLLNVQKIALKLKQIYKDVQTQILCSVYSQYNSLILCFSCLRL